MMLESKQSKLRQAAIIQKLCERETEKILETHKAHVVFDRINHDIETAWIRELPDTEVPVTHQMLFPLEKLIKKVNKRFYIGILTQRKENQQVTDDDFSKILDSINLDDIDELKQ